MKTTVQQSFTATRRTRMKRLEEEAGMMIWESGNLALLSGQAVYGSDSVTVESHLAAL